MNRNTLNWKNFLFFVLGKNYKNDMEKLKTEKKMQIFLRTICVEVFPNSLKLTGVTPLHKKDRKVIKENYAPVGIQLYEQFLKG